jgi:hypothetical protein
MQKLIDETRALYGRLCVVKRVRLPNKKEGVWECLCTCGTTSFVSGTNLRSGNVVSCGCSINEKRQFNNRTHGLSKTPTYNNWANMVQRCTNPKVPGYRDYGARGIRVCKRWLLFSNFYADMGKCPEHHTIERINNNRGYTPSNCCWATWLTQNNNKRSNRRLTVGTLTLCLTEWARLAGIRHATLRERLDRGWPVEAACTSPPRGKVLHIEKT